MRQLSVMVTVIAIILVVIFARGTEHADAYLGQSVFRGQTVFVQDEDTAFVNDEYAPVLHTGITYTKFFEVQEIVDLEATETVYLTHAVGGAFGEPSYRFTNISASAVGLEQNITHEEWELTYVGSFEKEEGVIMYAYRHSNITVGVSVEDFSIIESNGRYLLLTQEVDTIKASEVAKPFDIGMENIAFLVSILVIVGITAYWTIGKKRGWRLIYE